MNQRPNPPATQHHAARGRRTATTISHKVRALKRVKKTALYDGAAPIHQLLNTANDLGEARPDHMLPCRQSGRKARKGRARSAP